MKALYAFLAVLFFTIYIPAQAANIVDTKEPEKPKDTNSTNKSKVIAPAEKLAPIKIPKIGTPPTIDGKPDEDSWKNAAVFKDFYQTYPGDNTTASKPTEAYVMYDEKNLYIAFKCWDDKDKIRATIAKRDEVFGEDNVRMWLDTYNDQRRAYVIGFNPLGIQQDGIYTEGQGADFSVDIVMESKGVIEDWGWSVEVKIPFKSLRYAAGKGKMWGFNVARNIDRLNDEFDQWLPDDRNVSGFLIKHGKITGLDDVKFERTLEIVPSVTISETGSRKTTIPNAGFDNPIGRYDPIFNPNGIQDPGKFVNDPIKKDIGVNLKYTITPNVTLDAAVNPDYAEIEADAPVVLANQRFPIFFREKRPFFLEGKEIFDSPLQPFYSRTIIDPDFAAKLTGKINKTSFGFLAASDNAPGNYSEDERTNLSICQQQRLTDPSGSPFRRCGIEEFVDKNAFFSVLRVKRDFGKNNNIGFFGTARIFPKNRNFVGGFDGTFKLDKSTVMTFQVLGTHSRKNFYSPNLDKVAYKTGNGIGYYWSLDYTKEKFGYFIEASGRSSNYRADSGFTRRTNTNTVFGATRFSTKSNPKAKIIQLNSNQFARYTYDWKGRFQGGFAGANINAQLQGNTFLYFETGIMREHIYEEEFGAKRNSAIARQGAFFGAAERTANQPYFSFNINKTFSKRLSAYGFVGSVFNAFDYDFGGGGRFLRTSPAYKTYLSSPEYREYLRLLAIYQADPINNAPPNAPPEPGLDPGSGRQFDAQIGFEYKPIDPLRFSLDYTKSRLKRNDNGEVAFDTNIFSMRSTYQFSRFVYTRLRVDYDTLQRNVSGQFLFGWNPNPGTAFYVGYNDNV
ncbi:MAG: DUF5916 domain-containing protein, partial [Actinomycetota bacterium]